MRAMVDRLTPYEALLACEVQAGSLSQMARDLDVPQPTLWKWKNASKRLPAEHVLAAERLYGVSRHDLRPDIYPRMHMVDRPGPDRFYARDLGIAR